MSKILEAKKHLSDGLREITQAMSLLGQEMITNDAYTTRFEILFGCGKTLNRILDSLDEEEEQS